MSEKAKVEEVQKNENVKDIVKSSPMQLIFFIAAGFTIALQVPFGKACYDFIVKAQANKPKDYEFPKISDFSVMLVTTVFFTVLQFVCEYAFKGFVKPYIKKCASEKELDMRATKSAKYFYRFFYFSFAVAWGFNVLIDNPAMPPCMGGTGSLAQMWQDYPYQNHAPWLKEYLLYLTGYHNGGLVMHFITSRKNDFVEMGLHHIVAMYLFGGCYLFNAWGIGGIIALLHDIADICTGIVKCLAETRFSNATAVAFVIHMSVWFYTRLLVLPYMMYMIWITPVDMGSAIAIPSFVYLLGCMFLLHCYWFMLFCKMLKKYTTTGATEDIQSKTALNKKKE